jgi:hypothetical protein
MAGLVLGRPALHPKLLLSQPSPDGFDVDQGSRARALQEAASRRLHLFVTLCSG